MITRLKQYNGILAIPIYTILIRYPIMLRGDTSQNISPIFSIIRNGARFHTNIYTPVIWESMRSGFGRE